MSRTLLTLALALALAGPQVQAHDNDDGGGQGGKDRAGQDISHVNGGISTEDGQRYGDLDTVNGGVHVGRGTSADDVETVNGGITLEDQSKVGSVQTVNGGITAGQHVDIQRGAETVNGGIRVGFNSHVGGDVSTVNGGIVLQQSQVGGELGTVGGDITVGAHTVVHGGIHVDKPHGISWGRQRVPRIVIGPDAVVEGPLRFERKVELFVHPSARIGAVTGATVQRWTDTLPARVDD